MLKLRTAAFLAALFLPSVAAAQCSGPLTLPANTMLGRLGVGPGPCQQVPFSALGPSLITNYLAVTAPLAISGLNLSITGSGGKVLYGSPPAFSNAPQLGLASSLTGSLTFAHASNVGTVTLRAPSTATTWNLTFPTTAGSNGQALITDGSGNTSWAAGTGTVNSGTAGQVAYYPSTAASVSGNAALTFSGSIVVVPSGLALGGATIGSNILAVTGTTAFNSAVTMSAALTYGGVTLSNAVTGTGSMVLSAAPTLTGVTTLSGGAALGGAAIGGNSLAVTGTSLFNSGVTFGAAITYGGVTLSNAVTGTGKMVLDTSPTIASPTISSAAISGATITTSTINGNTITTGTGVLTLAAAKTLTVSNTLTLAGTDATTITFQGTDTYVGRTTTDTLINKTLTAPTINGGTHTAITSLGIRSTGTGAFDLTLANSENLTAGRTLTLTLNNAPRTISLSGNVTTAADFTTAGANTLTLTTTGTTNVTMPTTGTLAVQNAVNTFSAINTFSALQQFTDIKFSSGKLYPTADSTTALQVTKADGTTRIMNFDTTNARVGINKTAGAFDLDVNGAVNVGSTLTFLTLDATSLSTSTSTVTGLTANNSPSASNDYVPYYSAADGRIRKATVSALTSAGVAGVSSLNGLTGGLSVAVGNGLSVTAAASTVTLASYLDPGSITNCTLTGTVSGNALTVALKTQSGADPSAAVPCFVSFRNATNGTGDYTVVSVTAATSFATGTSGSTFGSSSGSHPFRLWVVAINNGGTVVLGVTELSNANLGSAPLPLNESLVQSTTACSACTNATALGTIYSTAAQTSKAIRILGYMDWNGGLATAGTWASGPGIIVMMGPGIKKPGDIVQFQYATSSTIKAYNNTTQVQTDLTKAITPTSASNLIAVTVHGGLEGVTQNVNFYSQISRGSAPTLIGAPGYIYQNQGTGAFQYGQYMFALDAPESIVSVSYFVYIVCDNTCSGNWNNNLKPTTMRIEEIMG